jgi:cysteine desulfurase
VTYLDANATEPLRPEARAAVIASLDIAGNPSSVHASGRAARLVLEQAREDIAARFGARPAQIVFTSGGTEADALAVHALGQGRRLLIGATEHDAVRAAAPDATIVPVDGRGVADLVALERLLAAGPALLCLMLANNETGVIQPVAEAASLCRAHGAWLHVDAVQAGGRMAVDFVRLGATSLAISSHKLGGPSGAGALLLDDAVGIRPLITGGGQERGWRGGTPPVAPSRVSPRRRWRHGSSSADCATRSRRRRFPVGRWCSAAGRDWATPAASRCPGRGRRRR